MAGTIQADSIANSAGTGAPNFPNGISVVGGETNVNASYQKAGAPAILISTPTTIQWDVKIWDTHNAMNTSTGEYTVPVSGVYSINSTLMTSPINMVQGTFAEHIVSVNGVDSGTLERFSVPSTVNDYLFLHGIKLIKVLAGDIVTIIMTQNIVSLTLNGTPSTQYVDICKVGY